ncbi:MAG TPA: glycosyltransferase family 4 protein [Acidimicrobiales bacterium]|nr:glycosyltransferase family 4 protein [Acidimicrobiales bacterium]
MKVLVVADELEPYGGQERSLVDVTEGLVARGHAVDLLYRAGGSFEERYRRACRSMTRIATLRGREGQRFHRAALLRAALGARRTAADVDVVYLNDDRHAFVGGVLSRLPRRPVVCHLRLPVTTARTRQDRLGLPLVDRFIAVSAATRDEYTASGFDPGKLDVVHNGIDPGRFPFGDEARRAAARAGLGLDGQFTVLFVGRLDHAKGIETLLDAWAALGLGPDEGRLVLAGEARNHRSAAEAEAYVTSLRSRAPAATCLWAGKRSDVVPLYHAADVVALPSVFPEPFGRVLVEGMACGRPAVGSAVGGIPEILTGELAGGLVPPRDPAALAAALGRLRGWRDRDPGLAERCRAAVERRFTLDRTVDGVEAVLERAVADLQGGGPSRSLAAHRPMR